MSEPRRADSVLMSDAAHIDVHAPRGAPRSRRLLRLAGDERLVAQIRRGNEAAFEVAFERHGAGILAFCRHMLGSPEEAEDAVQHTFAAAYRDLLRDEREITLKPWLYTIARNRCLSMLRARRDIPDEQPEVATAGLAEQVERRAELRELLADIRELPDEQRAALLLAEVGDLAHAEIASVLGCEVARVKALVFRARSGLIGLSSWITSSASCANAEVLKTLPAATAVPSPIAARLLMCRPMAKIQPRSGEPLPRGARVAK